MAATIEGGTTTDVGSGAVTVASLAKGWAMQAPGQIAMREKDFGIWKEYNWAQTWDLVETAAHALLATGVDVGDRVAIHSEDRPEWVILDLAAVGLANEQVGGSQFVMEMAVQYAKDRVQFGRPIGSFQAIKHKCADMLLEVESAKSAAYYASWCASEMNDELPSVASLAKAYCSEAYFHCAAENIQIHGGIGFTWEHPAHLYF